MKNTILTLSNKLLAQRMPSAIIPITVFGAQSILDQTTSFTYQGKLIDGGVPTIGQYDPTFKLFDLAAGGTHTGADVVVEDVQVTAGIFTVMPLSNQFPGAKRFMEISVRPGPGVGAFTLLSPRQPLRSAPYAIKSLNSDNADNLGGLAANTHLQTNGNGSQSTDMNGANITNNTIKASALASDTFPNSQNRSRLGQLRWDLLGQRVTVSTSPRGVAFDGANIWVANFSSNNVTKLRVLDGAHQGTFAVGTGPNGVAFDGANIWVANSGSDTVTKLRASDGALQGTFAVGKSPRGVAFDGTNIWVANFSSNNVTKLRVLDGVLQETFAVGTNPIGVAFDGANIWVANLNSANVTKLRASDGALQGMFAVGTQPVGVAFDGANIWVANNSSDNVTKLRASDGVPQGTFGVGTNPRGVAFDGANIWVANLGSNNVTKLRSSDGVLLGNFAIGTGPFGVAFDGANMWVANQGSNNVVKLPVFP